MGKVKDLAGQRFGMLTVVDRVYGKYGANRSVVWRCVCDCGNETEVTSTNLRNLNTRSCGCLLSGNIGHTRNMIIRQRYMEENGKSAPRGKSWIFLDGDKDNFQENNILFVSYGVCSMLRNRGLLDTNDPEIVKAGLKVIELKRTVSKLTRFCSSVG